MDFNKTDSIMEGATIDYKNVKLLKKCITERGKIMPRRLTGANSKQQRKLALEIKRARFLALVPFVDNNE